MICPCLKVPQLISNPRPYSGGQAAETGGKGQRGSPEFKRPDNEANNQVLLAQAAWHILGLVCMGLLLRKLEKQVKSEHFEESSSQSCLSQRESCGIQTTRLMCNALIIVHDFVCSSPLSLYIVEANTAASEQTSLLSSSLGSMGTNSSSQTSLGSYSLAQA